MLQNKASFIQIFIFKSSEFQSVRGVGSDLFIITNPLSGNSLVLFFCTPLRGEDTNHAKEHNSRNSSPYNLEKYRFFMLFTEYK